MRELAMIGLLLIAQAAIAAETPRATVVDFVQPVLIRHENSPLLRVEVEAPQVPSVRVTSFVFSLEGTSDLREVESIRLFTTGEKPAFHSRSALGTAQPPADRVLLKVDTPLRPGRNTFWLTCRLRSTADLTHGVSAKCLAVETTAGRLIPTSTKPAVRHRIGIALRQHHEDGVHTSRIPALTTSSNGSLLCVFDMRRRMGRDLQEDIDIGLVRSTQGGKNWEPTRVIMDMGTYGGLPQEQNGCSDPGIIVDRKTGDIFCFAVWMNGKPGKHQWVGDGSEAGFEIGKSAQFMMVRSQDDGLTWSKLENLTRKLKLADWKLIAPSPQSGIQLDDGTLVMPVEGRNARDAEFSTIMISRDHGQTWSVGSPSPTKTSECQAVLLGDGSIMLNARNEEPRERHRAVYSTRDLGRTWTAHSTNRNTLIEPNCNGSLLRFDYVEQGKPRHVLLFANPQSQKARVNHTIQASFDDGLTWPKSNRILLDEGAGAGYPSLTRIDDHHVGIVYEGSSSQLVFEKIALSDLLRPAVRSVPAALESGKQ
jgi:sialidase-1